MKAEKILDAIRALDKASHALIVAALAVEDEPTDAVDILRRCREVIRVELAVRAGTLAQDIVDARLDDEQWHAKDIRGAA